MNKLYEWLGKDSVRDTLIEECIAYTEVDAYRISVEEMGAYLHFVVSDSDKSVVQATLTDSGSVFEPEGFFPPEVKKELVKRLRKLRKNALEVQYESFVKAIG